MLKSYLTIATRSFLRHKGYTVMNLGGLVLGFACALVIGMYVVNELTYDARFDGEDVYRVVREIQDSDGVYHTPRSTVPMGPALRDEIPELAQVVRFWRSFQATLKAGANTFEEPGLYFTDPEAFEVFPLDFVRGNSQEALVAPGSVVLTEAAAARYFGNEDPIGKALAYDGYPGEAGDLVVTGIIRDLPENTHLSFTALASLAGVETEQDNWGSNKPIWTYVRVRSESEALAIVPKLAGFANRHLNRGGDVETVRLQPIREIHFDQIYTQGFKPGTSRSYVTLLGALGVLILLLACANFVNLATARSLARSREVGMRKALGAHHRQLVGQFLAEAVVLAVGAAVVGTLIVNAALPFVNGLLGKELTFSLSAAPWLVVGIPALALATGLLAGLYPALFIARFRPVAALSARVSSDRGVVRRGLVVFQFAISAALIVATVAVKRQLDFVQAKDLGITGDQVLVVPYAENPEPLMDALATHPNIRAAAISQRVPVNEINSDTRPFQPEGFDEWISLHSYVVGEGFEDVFELKLAAGRFLSLDRADAEQAFVINRAAVGRFGWSSAQEAVGKHLDWQSGRTSGPIVGVVEDFHLASIHETIPPLAMQMLPEDGWWKTWISMRLGAEDAGETLAFVEEAWRSHAPDGVYRHFFIDESFERLHRADARFSQVVGLFAMIAIWIGCLGLYGLAAFTTQRRTKEVAIRRTLGASVSSIFGHLSREYARLVLVAFFVGSPIAYLLMTRWLTRFAYRVEVSWDIFLVAGLTVMLLALMAVGYHAVRTATLNPVDSLRSE